MREKRKLILGLTPSGWWRIITIMVGAVGLAMHSDYGTPAMLICFLVWTYFYTNE
jgi:hypothetical protein